MTHCIIYSTFTQISKFTFNDPKITYEANFVFGRTLFLISKQMFISMIYQVFGGQLHVSNIQHKKVRQSADKAIRPFNEIIDFKLASLAILGYAKCLRIKATLRRIAWPSWSNNLLRLS